MSKVSFLFAALIASLFSGCAFTPHNIELEYQPQGIKESRSLGDLYFSKLRDDRLDNKRIGIVKNSYGTETANVLTNQDVTVWIK